MNLLEVFKNMLTGDVVHPELDDTTYVVRTETGFDICDNGEQVSVNSPESALQIVNENAEANA